MYRSHSCGQLRASDLGITATLSGWVHSRRDHGGVLFIDLRDREGLVQVVFNPEKTEIYKSAETLRSEFVIKVSGPVRKRPEGTENKNLGTGEIELAADSLEILNTSQVPPFEISQFSEASEEIRLEYRYLDLRRPTLQRNLILRHKIAQNVRETLNKEGFLEIETPMLTKSTPEGARDFLVPSRLNPGNFYALPQSPQLFKQILMVGGLDKYYQIVRCFRDEDLRSDRQPEFTQIDLEMSFVDEADVMGVTEKMVAAAFKAATGQDVKLPFLRMPYKEAMDKYGSDKPDLRFGLELMDVTEEVRNCGFQVFAGAVKDGGVVKAICLKGGASTARAEIDRLTDFVRKLGAKGLAWIKFTDSGPDSAITKFFSEEDLDKIQSKTGANAGDLLLFGAGAWKSVVNVLGTLRTELAKRNYLYPKEQVFKFLWVVDFPLLEWDDKDKRWNAMHHPFTSPDEASLATFEKDPGAAKARAYDIVLNGTELGGGSVRIHRKDVQSKVFSVLGISAEAAKEKFGFLLTALDFGAPPHGGIALGLDRFVALLLGEDSIRDTIAFPKTQKGTDLLSGSPSPVAPKQLQEIFIKTDVPKKIIPS
ncbi:MAG: aspartate--tRNA ligase [Elusimicrobia bacterium RIFCSPLOWO2_01_FULL_54_10]|nr:MAG: aspartate--tRNA ligase [Elusimicrobia bacterium RIFCSPLOWO2_01_FULL_54_10]